MHIQPYSDRKQASDHEHDAQRNEVGFLRRRKNRNDAGKNKDCQTCLPFKNNQRHKAKRETEYKLGYRMEITPPVPLFLIMPEAFNKFPICHDNPPFLRIQFLIHHTVCWLHTFHRAV